MAGTRVGAAIDAIVAALRADATVTGLAEVVDGPVVEGDNPEARVFVGFDGDKAGTFGAVDNWTQEWKGLGAQHKDEYFEVLCAVWSWSGDSDIAARRARAFELLDAIQTALRAPLNIGLGLPQTTIAEWSQGQLFQEPVIRDADGTVLGFRCRIPFRIHVKTRI